MLQQQFTNSDSLEALFSICSSKEEQKIETSDRVYSREFQEMLDSLESEDCDDENGVGSAKKRRLSVDQVRALEKHFDVENKLDPERKVRLATELGLQERQVAIWFQNRRARWKTKQLEREFRVLKANYDSLNLDFNALKDEKETLSIELEELKEKLRRRRTDDKLSSKQSNSGDETATAMKGYGDFKDNGSSESDSNEMSREENDVVFYYQPQLLSPPPGTGFQDFSGQLQPPPAAANWFQLPDLRLIPAAGQHYVKMEDQGLFDSDESCNVLLFDQAPTFQWYSS